MSEQLINKTLYKRSAYTPAKFSIIYVHLEYKIFNDIVEVQSEMTVLRKEAGTDRLVLSGENMELLSVSVDNRELAKNEYRLTDKQLGITAPDKDSFTVSLRNRIDPWNNTALEGLYKSGRILCTQNEAEGFRRITWFLDRPDNMCRFTTRIEADKTDFPVLLSNGNLKDSGELNNNRHFAVWEDPFPKPCYLYALVAGKLGVRKDTFQTMSGRNIELAIYTDPGQEPYSGFAMEALKKSMKWDEEVFGREYDLDLYMIVAVDSFNAGAMENKGLNIFNSKYVLADEKTATDRDKQLVEAVIAHEYFHNWTGNRVTCRDWFQLTLKEGLTVFRDQEFTSDTASRPIKRIEDARVIKEHQFAEDAGPNSHPIRPESYMEVDNLYTATVYEKGAEVIRMIHTLLGPGVFRKGMDLYFKRHDGQAVTCDDFVSAMADASEINLDQFRLWYSRPGTPEINLTGTYNRENSVFELKVEQKGDKEALYFPLGMSLLDYKGNLLTDERVLTVSRKSETFLFEKITEPAVPSLFHQFSAPVKWSYDYSRQDLLTLFEHDRDSFSRYEAGQRIMLQDLSDIYSGTLESFREDTLKALQNIMDDTGIEADFKSLLITLPGLESLGDHLNEWDFQKLHNSRKKAVLSKAVYLEEYFTALSDQKREILNDTSNKGGGVRALAVHALQNLSLLGHHRERVGRFYENSDNITLSIGALNALCTRNDQYRDKALEDFYGKWKDNFNLSNKWLAMQTGAADSDAWDKVHDLQKHALYDSKNPNRLRSVIMSFSRNMPEFHHPSGRGYNFLADKIIEIDKQNPYVTASMARSFEKYSVLPENMKNTMGKALDHILAEKELSPGTYEIISKTRKTG